MAVTWLRKTFLALALLSALIGAGLVVSNHDEIIEAFQQAACGASCPELPPEQLRLQVIKRYLHNQLASSIESRSAGGYYEIAILQRDLTREDIQQEIQNETLVRTLTTNATIFTSYEQINALRIDAFVNHPTIAFYSLSRRDVRIIPTRSIQATTQNKIEEFQSNRGIWQGKYYIPPFTWWEKQRGYGRYYFEMANFSRLDLGCCDGLGDTSKNGSTPHKSKKESLLNLKSDSKYFMFISNRGAILNRYRSDG